MKVKADGNDISFANQSITQIVIFDLIMALNVHLWDNKNLALLIFIINMFRIINNCKTLEFTVGYAFAEQV